MMRHELEALTEAVLDGTASPAERERLDGWIRQSPEARETWESVRAAHESLAGAGLSDPPPGLSEAILRVVEREPIARPRGEGWLPSLGALFSQRPALRLGFAFAVGLAVGVLGLGAFLGSSHGLGSNISATLAPVPATSHQLVGVAGARVDVSIAAVEGGSDVRLVADASSPADVSLEWNPAQLRLDSLRWPQGPVSSSSIASGHLALAIDRSTRTSIHFVSISEDARLRVTVRSGDRSAEHEFTLPQ